MTADLVKPNCQFFYKYKPADHPDYIRSIILDHQLYFPTPSQLNDPLEAKPQLISNSLPNLKMHFFRSWIAANPGLSAERHARAMAEIEAFTNTHGREFVLGLLQSDLHPILDAHRIFSLAKRWDNMTNWVRYASNHTGVCLEFANEGPPFSSTYEVKYDGQVLLDITEPEQLDTTFFFHKSAGWHHEEEIRIVTHRGCPPTVQFDPSLLTRLILGKDVLDTLRLKILEWARMRQPKLLVVQAAYDDYEQKLVQRVVQRLQLVKSL